VVKRECSEVLFSCQILLYLALQYQWHPFIVVPGDLISMNKQTPEFPDTLATYTPVREVFHLLSPLSKSHPLLPDFPTAFEERFSDIYLKTGVLFLLTVLPPQPKKGAAARPLNCRVKIPLNQSNCENTRLNPYFLLAWTRFSLIKKTHSSVW
jgi:hypothetical protein